MATLPAVPNGFHFGVEVEGYLPATTQFADDRPTWSPDTWMAVHDGSVVSPSNTIVKEFKPNEPLRGTLGVKRAKRFLNLARRNGFRVNHTCGQHVHVSYHIYVASSIKVLLKNLIVGLANVEKGIYAYNGKNGREFGEYARPMRDCIAQYYGRERYPDNKYWGLNLLSLGSKGSMEFRYYTGTTDSQLMELNINLSHQLCLRASQGETFPDLSQQDYEQAGNNLFEWVYDSKYRDYTGIQRALKLISVDYNVVEPSRPIPNLGSVLSSIWSDRPERR